jgi:hypothetical protein
LAFYGLVHEPAAVRDQPAPTLPTGTAHGTFDGNGNDNGASGVAAVVITKATASITVNDSIGQAGSSTTVSDAGGTYNGSPFSGGCLVA